MTQSNLLELAWYIWIYLISKLHLTNPLLLARPHNPHKVNTNDNRLITTAMMLTPIKLYSRLVQNKPEFQTENISNNLVAWNVFKHFLKFTTEKLIFWNGTLQYLFWFANGHFRYNFILDKKSELTRTLDVVYCVVNSDQSRDSSTHGTSANWKTGENGCSYQPIQ